MSNRSWGELERVSATIDELRERQIFAQKTGNQNRLHVLANELRAAEVRRAQLIDRIAANLVGAG